MNNDELYKVLLHPNSKQFCLNSECAVNAVRTHIPTILLLSKISIGGSYIVWVHDTKNNVVCRRRKSCSLFSWISDLSIFIRYKFFSSICTRNWLCSYVAIICELFKAKKRMKEIKINPVVLLKGEINRKKNIYFWKLSQNVLIFSAVGYWDCLGCNG